MEEHTSPGTAAQVQEDATRSALCNAKQVVKSEKADLVARRAQQKLIGKTKMC